MKPQLTLQTPLELPYQEISNYLNKLWISEDKDNSGANTFTLMVWQPAWLEQCLVQKGLVNGPITGNLSPEIIKVAKKFILDQGLPITTSLNSEELLKIYYNPKTFKSDTRTLLNGLLYLSFLFEKDRISGNAQLRVFSLVETFSFRACSKRT